MSTPPRYEAAFTDPRNDHPVVHSLVNGELLLDVKIAPIIDFLLSNGVKTLFSCQGDPFTKVLPPTYESVFLSRKYAGYISCLDSENLFKATELLAGLAEEAGALKLTYRILGYSVILDLNGDTIFLSSNNRKDRAWTFDLSRGEYRASSASSKLFKATARMCYEDIEELGKLLGY